MEESFLGLLAVYGAIRFVADVGWIIKDLWP
jgi:hypothetical protein